MTAAEAPLPSFVEGELAARKIRLLHHVRLLLGLTPILAMLALGPNATLLRILLVFTLLATVADLVVNQWLRGGISMWAELPRTIDLPPASAAGFDEPVAQASVPVRIAVPRGAGSAGRFVYGLTSITKLWSDRLIDGAVPVVAERRGRLATVSFEVETGGVFMHAHTVLGFVFTPVQPILVVPAAIRDEAGRAALDRFEAAATAELDVVGVRPWRDGDQRRDVHWAATARAGDVIVADRIAEPDTTRRVEIAATAVTERELCEVLGRARYLAELALGRGWTIDLVTATDAGLGVPAIEAHTVTDTNALLGILADAVPSAADAVLAAERSAAANASSPDHRFVVRVDGTGLEP
ncbi:MAG: DUF58 domain-containing protein [Acidimicrobiales bacterium]